MITNTKLNKAQQSAVNSNANRILVLAGAGTGKTFTMIERIFKLIDVDKVSPESVLVLTFTNAAAFEMKDRFMRRASKYRCPEFRTFHSFCYSLIMLDNTVRERVGYVDVPSIASDDQIRSIETKCKIMLNIKLSTRKLNLPDDKLTDAERFEKCLYHKQYYKMLKQANLITFDILCYHVCKLFVDDDECIRRYKSKYKYILVDEYQDTDSKQNDFIMSFVDSNIFVVGDALQALYSFRGADSSLIKKLASDPGWQTIKLHENFRSTVQICECANNMSDYADETYRVEIHGRRDGAKPVFCNIADPKYDEPVSNYQIKDIMQNLKIAEGNSAILCRTNAEVDYIVHQLTDVGIHPRTSKRNVDAVNVLKSVLDLEYRKNWLSTFLNANQYGEYLRLCFLNEAIPEYKVLQTYYGNQFKIKQFTDQIFNIIDVIKSDKLRFQKSADILKILNIPQDTPVNCEVSKASEFINNMISSIEQDSESGVYVGTIHSAKGLEYDNVFLLNVNTRLFPLTNEDNLNLYYVGITRAKNYLKVYRRD